MHNAVAENVLGTVGTVLWCIQLIPQIIRNYKVKDCTGFPPMMMFLWCASGVPFSIYFVGTNGAIPLRIQPQLFTFFCLICWGQSLYYPPVQWRLHKVAVHLAVFVVISVGLEVGLVVWLRPLYERDIKYPMLIVGIIAAILLGVGLIPPYFELAKRRGRVVGINFVFLTVDSLGALTSLLSIVVGTVDVLSMVLYCVVLGLEIGIFSSQMVWYFCLGGRRIIREEAKINDQKKEDQKKEGQSNNDVKGNDNVDTKFQA